MTPDIVLGPPGTGKTTTLIGVVKEELARGTPPDRIGYVSFTRRAAEEAATRAGEQLKLSTKELVHFRTLHSLCFRHLGLRRGDVFEGPRVQEFAAHAGVRITGRFSEDGTLTGMDTGDRILFLENVARVRGIPLRAAYDAFDDNLPWREVERVAGALAQFKKARGLMDYTDMLDQFVVQGIQVKLDALVVDEAQDLSALQWRVVRALAASSARLTVAGDDDQAIYRWAGADVDHLIEMQGRVRVLNQSYRVPRGLQAAAVMLLREVPHRREKEWRAREGSLGTLSRLRSFPEVDCGSGEVLVLARNAYVLREQVEPALRREGIVYERNGHPSVSPKTLEAITTWEALRQGEAVSVPAARAVYEHMSSGARITRGHKELKGFADEEPVTLDLLKRAGGLLTEAIWHEAMDRLPPGEVAYIVAARRRGEKLRQRPRVRLSTIHGSKGGEADHVVLMKEMARRTHHEMTLPRGREDEARVWYVGATRARERLTVVASQTAQACPWL